MSKISRLILIMLALLSFSSTASANIIIYNFKGIKIIKIADFPKTSKFKIKTGDYLDAGYFYRQFTIFFIPVWNYDGKWVGYIGSDSSYLPLKKSDLDNLAKSVGITLPENPSLPFWDAMSGKLILSFFVLFGVWSIWFKKEKKDNKA